MNYEAPVKNICDFCSHPAPTWEYPCHNFVNGSDEQITAEQAAHIGPIIGIPEMSAGTYTWIECDGWLACEDCHKLIESADWIELAEHAVRSPYGTFAEVRKLTGNNEKAIAALCGGVRKLHRQFIKARIGPARPFTVNEHAS